MVVVVVLVIVVKYDSYCNRSYIVLHDFDYYDFDSDSDIEPRRFDKINQKVPAKSRNKYVTGLYSALGITDEEVQKLKNNESSSKSNLAVPVSKSGRPLPEVIVFDDPSKRQKVHVVKLLLSANVHALYIFN